MLSSFDIFIAAGGKSSRMGQDKGLIDIGGKKMVTHLTDRLNKNGFDFTVIANSDGYLQLGFRVIKDVLSDKGPMGALYTAFCNTDKDYVLLLGCDTPFFPMESLYRLIEKIDFNETIVSQTKHGIDPLHGFYSIKLKNKVLYLIQNNELKMQNLVLQSKFTLVNMGDIESQYPDGFLNMNNPKDIDKWKISKQIN
ncbi:MAG: molybdenum cofactor guanylyltransferase [Bacteroidetes bacterium]|nr:molybdenum cofactor guanylyltransferase [Bacteroidota bacterium]